MADIKPGQWITVKVKAQPRAAAGKKTLVRLFEQDAAVRKERRRLSRSRITKPARRGGRLWNNIPQRLDIVAIAPGAQYRIFGSVEDGGMFSNSG